MKYVQTVYIQTQRFQGMEHFNEFCKQIDFFDDLFSAQFRKTWKTEWNGKKRMGVVCVDLT